MAMATGKTISQWVAPAIPNMDEACTSTKPVQKTAKGAVCQKVISHPCQKLAEATSGVGTEKPLGFIAEENSLETAKPEPNITRTSKIQKACFIASKL